MNKEIEKFTLYLVRAKTGSELRLPVELPNTTYLKDYVTTNFPGWTLMSFAWTDDTSVG